MAEFKRKGFRVTAQQDVFLKRKVKELRRRMPRGEESLVSESSVIQGLIDLWMTEEARRTT